MKTGLIITVVLLIVFFILQGFISKSSSNTEQYSYTVLKEYSQFEVRKYEAALFTSVDLSAQNYKSNSGGGFRILANYIFGGNANGEQIAMTSPVVMNMDTSSQKMSFMVPKGYQLDSMPQPNDTNIYFEQKEGCTMAAVRFGGWANDKKIEKNKQKLIQLLEKQGLKHRGNFSYMGYNPPYEMLNRRNEVVVELTSFDL
jgi:hypothetical protein